MIEFDLQLYEKYLFYRTKNYNKYLSDLIEIASREDKSLHEIANNVVFYIYVYKNATSDLDNDSRKKYLLALKYLYEFLNPKPIKLVFRADLKKKLDVHTFEDWQEKLNRLTEDEFVNQYNSIKIERIERGSIVAYVIAGGLILSFCTLRALKLIKEFTKAKEKGELSIRKATKGVLIAMQIILSVGTLFAVSSSVTVGSNPDLTIEVIGELLTLISELL